MTIEEFNTGFNYLIGHFPNTKNLKSVSYAYFEDLKDTLTGKEFIIAIKKIIRSGKLEFIPKVSEIVRVARGSCDIDKQVFYAKKLLKTALNKNGGKGMVCFEDKGVHAVVDYIGWNRLCTMKDDEFDNFLKWEFDDIYKGFCERPYETSDYYRGTSQLFGQIKPRMIGYKEAKIGNTENMNFIRLEYKNITAQIENKVDLSEIKNKMLIGG